MLVYEINSPVTAYVNGMCKLRGACMYSYKEYWIIYMTTLL